MKKHLIFDLDGTLIDSAPSILGSFSHAFTSKGMKTAIPLTQEVIGPPLMQTLAKLAGVNDDEVLAGLAQSFKEHYDQEGYKKTVVYDGVEGCLQQLQAAGYSQYIATNKRFNPTAKIMQHLGWNQYFNGVYALDFYTPALSNKGEMIKRLMIDEDLNASNAIYIGDRFEDGLAAEQNGLEFILVTWGYFDEMAAQARAEWRVSSSLEDLHQLLNC